MADKIKIYEDEYSDLKRQLCGVHEDILQRIEEVLKSVTSLNSAEGGFYTEQITPKIDLICSEMRTVKSTLEELYSSHEKVIESFQTVIDDLDTCC